MQHLKDEPLPPSHPRRLQSSSNAKLRKLIHAIHPVRSMLHNSHVMFLSLISHLAGALHRIASLPVEQPNTTLTTRKRSPKPSFVCRHSYAKSTKHMEVIGEVGLEYSNA